MGRDRWGYELADHDWPGLFVYLEEKNYDTSKVVAISWDVFQGKNAILDSRAEDSGRCKCFNLYLCQKS